MGGCCQVEGIVCQQWKLPRRSLKQPDGLLPHPLSVQRYAQQKSGLGRPRESIPATQVIKERGGALVISRTDPLERGFPCCLRINLRNGRRSKGNQQNQQPRDRDQLLSLNHDTRARRLAAAD